MNSACPCSMSWGNFDVRFLILVLRCPLLCPSVLCFFFFYFFCKVKSIFLIYVSTVGELFWFETSPLSAHGWDMSIHHYNPTQYFKWCIFNKDSREVFLNLLSISSWHHFSEVMSSWLYFRSHSKETHFLLRALWSTHMERKEMQELLKHWQ